MRTLQTQKESAVVLEEVPRPEVLKEAEREEKNVSGQICPHCGKYWPPCPTKK